ncbi:MAG TPA: GTP 3',8-cyclase MoaA [Mycobacteriales bacterium]|nr:GTP 3',8-cyclase MoaA [Mycobacteriales bacterium]
MSEPVFLSSLPQTGALVDTFGRVHRKLRVSLTDRCNLRCTYCMPEQGLDWLARDTVLTDDEVVRAVTVMVGTLGVTHIRLTGGEPLLRPGLVELVRRFAAITPRPDLAITTNGIGLADVVDDLHAAGLNRINVSLDTLDARTFHTLTRRDRLTDVIAGIDAAIASGLAPVKVNTVLMRGINDHEALDLLHFCMDRHLQLRFIEQMPLDPQHGWDRDEMVSADEIQALLEQEHVLTPLDGRGSAPAEELRVDGGPHTVGIIGSMTRPFCASCDRLRLTADGQVRSCLFAREESDLRDVLRSGGTDDDVAAIVRLAVYGKRAGHGVDDPGFRQPDRPMSAIGG